MDRQQAIDALCARCEWADVALVRDVLFECGWDVEHGADSQATGHPTSGTPRALPSLSPPIPGATSVSSVRHPLPTKDASAGPAVHPGDAVAVHPGGATPQWALQQCGASSRQDFATPCAREALGLEAHSEAALAAEGHFGDDASVHRSQFSAALEALEVAFAWADPGLLRDILETFQGDAEAARGWLQSVERGAEQGGAHPGVAGGATGWRVDQGCADAAYRALRADAFKATRYRLCLCAISYLHAFRPSISC